MRLDVFKAFRFILAWGIFFTILVSIVRLGASTPQPIAVAKEECFPEPLMFMMGAQVRPATQREKSGIINFTENSTFYQKICQSGNISMVAYGKSAKNIAPMVIISLDNHTILTRSVREKQYIHIHVGGPGLLALTFGNDNHRVKTTPPENRSLFIRNWSFVPDSDLTE